MGDMGELFNAWKDLKKEKKASNYDAALLFLNKNQIPYESKNNGFHLVLNSKGIRIDFWPSTNKLMMHGQILYGALNRIKKIEF